MHNINNNNIATPTSTLGPRGGLSLSCDLYESYDTLADGGLVDYCHPCDNKKCTIPNNLVPLSIPTSTIIMGSLQKKKKQAVDYTAWDTALYSYHTDREEGSYELLDDDVPVINCRRRRDESASQKGATSSDDTNRRQTSSQTLATTSLSTTEEEEEEDALSMPSLIVDDNGDLVEEEQLPETSISSQHDALSLNICVYVYDDEGSISSLEDDEEFMISDNNDDNNDDDDEYDWQRIERLIIQDNEIEEDKESRALLLNELYKKKQELDAYISWGIKRKEKREEKKKEKKKSIEEYMDAYRKMTNVSTGRRWPT